MNVENIQVTSTTDTAENVALANKAPTTPEPAVAEPSEPEATEPEVEAAAETESVEPEGEEAEREEGEPEAEKKPKKKGGFQKRIDKLNAKLSAKDAEIEHWRQQALRREQAKETETPVAAKKPAEGKPSKDDFESIEEYYEALADWRVTDALAKEKQKSREEALLKEEGEKLTTHAQRVDKFKSDHDDFDEVVESVNHIQYSPTVKDLIVTSDLGPALMYELAKNPDEYARICKMSPAQAGVAIGKIEARLQKAPTTESQPEEPRKTKAPAPIKPVKGSSAAATKKSIFDADLSQAEYDRLREEQLKKKR